MRPDSGTPKKSAYWLKGIFRKNRVTGLGALQQMVLDAGFYNFPGPSKKINVPA
jgi:hypothetical protein